MFLSRLVALLGRITSETRLAGNLGKFLPLEVWY